MFDTPLVASVALRYTVTAETNQPLLPGVPDSDAVVTGATVSTFTVRDFVVSVSPALSVALYSTRCTPSPRTKGTEYVCQTTPSTRYEMRATPLVRSDAFRTRVASVTYQPLFPGVPEAAAVETGFVVSTLTLTEWPMSERPATSVAW